VKKSSHTIATPRNRYRIASAYSTHPPWLEIQPASLSLAQLVEARSERPCVCGFAEVSESFVRKPDGKCGKTPGESPRGRLPAFLPESPRTSAPTVPRPSAGASAASARRLATTTSAVCLCVRRDGGEVNASFGDREATEAACRRDGSPAREGKTKIAQMPRVGSPRRPARDRRRRLPETSATRLHAARVPVLRARVAPRADAAAKRTGGEPTHRATLPKPARL
jgi:hypothetical protein